MTERFRPDVLLLDITMPDLDGLGVLRELAGKQLPTRVLVLTMHAEEQYLVQALELGAAGYLVKSAADREKDVLRLVAEGYSAPEIGERLYISPKTVDTYKQRISEKLELAHRADYVKLALKLGLLSAT